MRARISRNDMNTGSINATAPDLDETHAKLFKNGKLKITLPRKTPLK